MTSSGLGWVAGWGNGCLGQQEQSTSVLFLPLILLHLPRHLLLLDLLLLLLLTFFFTLLLLLVNVNERFVCRDFFPFSLGFCFFFIAHRNVLLGVTGTGMLLLHLAQYFIVVGLNINTAGLNNADSFFWSIAQIFSTAKSEVYFLFRMLYAFD